MAANSGKCSDCAWLMAMCEKMMEDKRREEEELEYFKTLLWNSPGSWKEKEEAVEMDIVNASEEVINVPPNEEMEEEA